MGRYIQGVEREQLVLFPECVDDYILEDNPVVFISVFVGSLDLVELGLKYAKTKETGRPPYNPSDLLKLYIYGYLNRIRSSRRLEKETHRNVEVMWLIKRLTPDFKTIADFRKDNCKAVKEVFKQFIFLCKGLDLFGGELIGIDGSKFRAVNSKKRNFNKAKLERKIKEIEEKIEAYLKRLDEEDKREAEASVPNAQELKEKIEIFKQRKEEYKKLWKNLEESGEEQISLTDPDSHAMVNNQRIEVCYNVQVSVDDKHSLILDYEATNEVKDSNQLSKMAKRSKEILGKDEIEVTADKGYYDAVEIKECVDNGITPYIPEPKPSISKKINVPEPEFYKSEFKYNDEKDVYLCPMGSELAFRNKAKHHGKVMKLYKTKDCSSCELKNRCTRNPKGRIIYRWEQEELLEEMRERVRRDWAKVKKRAELTEHPFGTMKRAFNQGYMLMKGINKVGGEIGLTILAYNITRVINIVGTSRLIDFLRRNNQINGDEFQLFSYFYVLVPFIPFC